MKSQKFYSMILAAATVASASAAGIEPMQKLSANPDYSLTRQEIRLNSHQERSRSAKTLRRNVGKPDRIVRHRLPGAPDNLQIVTEVPQPDNLKLGLKSGAYYSYSFFTGMQFSNMSTNLSQYEIADGKFYMSQPLCASETNAYLVGDVEGNKITINFPQWVDHYEDFNYLGEPYELDTYVMLCEFVPKEEGSDEGWYYPTENQTLTLTIDDNGVIQNPDWENIMIGSCDWIKEEYNEDTDEYEPIENPYWDWNGNGDFISSITEFTGTPVEMPAGLTTEDWTMIDGQSGRKISVGIDGNDIYLQGLFTREGFNPVIKGKIDGDKATFETGQYVGAYLGNMTLVYFQGAHLVYDEEGYLTDAELLPSLEFTYDKDKKDLLAEETAIFSSMKDKVRYYVYYTAPHIFMPDASLTGKTLLNPVVNDFYPAEDGYSGDVAFEFPNVDAAGNMLDTSKLFYNIYIDGELFEIYPDEYPEDVEEDQVMTNIPYTHDGYDIYYSGTEHYFYFTVEGFDTFAIQTLYIDGDFENKSELVYAYRNDGVESITAGSEKKVEYFDLQGRRVSNRAKGMLIRRATLSDGSCSTTKVVKL